MPRHKGSVCLYMQLLKKSLEKTDKWYHVKHQSMFVVQLLHQRVAIVLRAVCAMVLHFFLVTSLKYVDNLPQATRCSDRFAPQEVLSPFVSWGLYFVHFWIWQTVTSPDSQGELPLFETIAEPSLLKYCRRKKHNTMLNKYLDM